MGLKKDIMRPSRGLSRALPAVSRRTHWEAGSGQPSRESPRLRATATGVDLVWYRQLLRHSRGRLGSGGRLRCKCCKCRNNKSDGTEFRCIKLRSTFSACRKNTSDRPWTKIGGGLSLCVQLNLNHWQPQHLLTFLQYHNLF